MADQTTVQSSFSTPLNLLYRGWRTTAESIGIGMAMCVGPTIYEKFNPLVENVGKLGFEKGWAESWKTGWAEAPAGAVGAGITGVITANICCSMLETMYGRKLTQPEELGCRIAGAVVAVGLQVGLFSGAGLPALLTAKAASALGCYVAAKAVTNVGLFLVEKPLQSLASFSKRVFTSAEKPAEAAPAPA